MKSACACTTKQIYRTEKIMCTCTTLPFYCTDKNNVYLHDFTDQSYRQKQCISARHHRLIVQTKTMYTCTTLPFYCTDKNSVYLHDITVLSYRQKQCVPARLYRFIVQIDKNGVHLFGSMTLQMYRTDKNCAPVLAAGLLRFMVQTKTVCTFLEAPRYRCIVETKNSVHLIAWP